MKCQRRNQNDSELVRATVSASHGWSNASTGIRSAALEPSWSRRTASGRRSRVWRVSYRPQNDRAASTDAAAHAADCTWTWRWSAADSESANDLGWAATVVWWTDATSTRTSASADASILGWAESNASPVSEQLCSVHATAQTDDALMTPERQRDAALIVITCGVLAFLFLFGAVFLQLEPWK